MPRKAIVYIRISHQSQSHKRQEEDLKNLKTQHTQHTRQKPGFYW